MTTDTDKASDKMVEMALKAAFEKGWCAAAQWAQRDDLRHDTGSIAYAGQRDAILAGKAAEVRAAIIADLCGDVEPVAFMFQHSETGRITFVDAWQKENGWSAGNPKFKEVGALYGASTLAAAQALNAELVARVEGVEKDAARYQYLRDGPEKWEMFESRWLINLDIYGCDANDMDAAIDAAIAARSGT